MKLDLHCHSSASDGKLSPQAVLHLAEEAELDYLALTDHDTIQGVMEILAINSTVNVISGVEISSLWQGVAIHIIGLDFDVEHSAISALLAQQRLVREKRARIIDQKLAAKGMPNTLAGALTYCPDLGQIGRPHFAQYLVDQGLVKNHKQAFDRWLGAGKIGDVKSDWPDIHHVIEVINASHGLAVLAHPLRYKLTFSKLRRLMQSFQDSGGAAVEVVGHQVSPDKQQRLIKAVADLSLMASGGSDFHDPQWRWAQLGHIPPLPSSGLGLYKLLPVGRDSCVSKSPTLKEKMSNSLPFCAILNNFF